MPELPEVETLRRQLAPAMVGRTITTAELFNAKTYSGLPGFSLDDVVGRSVVTVGRRAKYLIFGLSEDLALIMHLSLAGQLVLESTNGERVCGGHPVPAYTYQLPHRQTQAIFRLNDASILYFTDIRKFGHIWVAPIEQLGLVVPEKRLGVEILGPDYTLDAFRESLARRPNARLKPLLLDQQVIAGLGNIYVDESLWGAELHPERTAGSLSEASLARLYQEIHFVIELALAKGVAQILNARAVEGAILPRIHGREGKPCPRCGTLIQKYRVVGRGTYVCARCQSSEESVATSKALELREVRS